MQPIDAPEYDAIRNQVARELHRSISKHDWDDYTYTEMLHVIREELNEVQAALCESNFRLEHGVFNEAAQVSACAQKLMLLVMRREGVLQ